jgi:23S rRNA (adenine2503-C2)-methyltransferase
MTDFCSALGEKPFRARQLYTWLYGKGEPDFDRMTDVPVSAREKLAEASRTDDLVLKEELTSSDGQTTKYLFDTDDAGGIETVFMKYKDRNSICISVQAGCRMGCRFCASGALGLKRGLTPAEMALQVVLSERASGARTKNIVLMGIGEPLDNFDYVKKFIENITDDHGRDLSRRAITLSTCGLVPGIERLAAELPQVGLAVSLHAPNDGLRSQIMPITKKYGVTDVVAATRKHYEKTRRRPTYEYALIRGFNDGPEHAAELAALLKGMNCIVNLIPLNDYFDARNATKGGGSYAASGKPREAFSAQGSSVEIAERFREELGRRHVPATVRKSLGADIGAACGQLRLRQG